MKYIITHATGIYVFDENLNLIERIKVHFTSEDLQKIKEGKVLDKEKEIFEKLKEKYGKIIYLGKRDVGFEYTEDPEKIEKAMKKIRELAYEDLADMQQLFVEETIHEISKSIGRDQLIIQAINALDDLNKIINLMVERFREWYSLYFPELSMRIEDHKKFVKEVLKGSREELMKKHGIKRTMGGNFEDRDVEMLKEYSKSILMLYECREKLIEYINKLMREVAPNLTEIAGPLIGARLISLAGGLKELANLPSSTIQVLGAEKALFRHLSKGSPPPKHGVLFNHPFIQRLPKKLRGRMARTLAGKILIAAKVDVYSPGKDIAKKLKKELEERFNELKEGK